MSNRIKTTRDGILMLNHSFLIIFSKMILKNISLGIPLSTAKSSHKKKNKYKISYQLITCIITVTSLIVTSSRQTDHRTQNQTHIDDPECWISSIVHVFSHFVSLYHFCKRISYINLKRKNTLAKNSYNP